MTSTVPVASAACSVWIFNCDNPTQVPYCNSTDPTSPNYCSIDKGTDIVKNNVNLGIKDRKFSDYIQDVIVYLLSFLALLVVILILWAGFLILTAAGDEDKVKKAKSIIVYALAGLLLIFMAWAITSFILGDKTGKSPGLINAPSALSRTINQIAATFTPATAYAAENAGFEVYRARIETVAQLIGRDFEVDGKVKLVNLNELESAVKGSMDTYPEKERDGNTALANQVLTQVALVRKFPDSDLYADRLAEALRTYITGVKIGTITAKITATPAKGNAPVTVSLRATEARDPSGAVIPNENYVWWIRGANNVKQVIGKGPSIPYTFRNEAVYTVNLEISSSSRNNKGRADVIPFKGTQEVQVLPRLANILLFVNGANASLTDTVKITPSQGKNGIILDASSSTASPGATIIKTEWDFGNGNRTSYSGGPRLERQVFSFEGTYNVRLALTTNESNDPIIKEIKLISQDPIASIRSDKSSGFAGEEFKFSAASNVGNGLFTYEWSILDTDAGGKVLATSKGQTLNYKFPRMGNYVVRLKTLTAGGREDIDNYAVTINSKDPVAQFELKAVSSELPNTITIDATRSYDPDSLDASKLNFAWTIDGERVELDKSTRNGATGEYTFSTKGNHSVVLDLTNEQGKITQLKKEFRVDSLLAVKLIVTPKITQLGTPVTLVAESKDATVFEWDYGDGTRENTAESRAFHTYKTAGTYTARLTVRGGEEAGASNSISRTVYVADANAPFAVISVKRDQDMMEPVSGACPGGAAYVVDRTRPVSILWDESINTDGTTNGLTYTWKYQGKNSSQKQFSYKFDELGCFPVTLTVRSTKANTTSTSTVLVKVENALPTFASLSVSADKTDSDPVVITVTANNAVDPDGVITSYLWYYYTDADPEPQDFRITKTPKTAFVVPRINGKYFFALTMEDSNGAKINSEEAREERFSITLASDNINTPLIQLKASTSQAKVGESISFQAEVKNVVGQILTDKVEYKWDYDGDGFYDATTTTPTVSHSYDKPGTFNMKVKASYRGISNTRYQQIVIRNDLEPNLEYFSIGNRFVFINTTKGVYSKAKWTLGKNSSDALRTWVVNIDEGEDPGELTLEVSDGTSTKTTTTKLRKDVVNASRLKNSTEAIEIFAYPTLEDGKMVIQSATDPAYLYLGESKSVAKYSIDADIKVDSDLNGDPADDVDNKGTDSVTTGAPFELVNTDAPKSRTIRITLTDAAGKKIATKDIVVELAYLTADAATMTSSGAILATLSDGDKVALESLKDLIRTTAPEGQRVKLMQYITQIQENWNDVTAKTKTIIDFQQSVSELGISEGDKNKFLTILDGFLLSDSETKDDIGLATSVLRKLIPASNVHYEEIFGKDGKGGLVGEILGHPTDLERNKEIASKIAGFIKDDNTISDDDKLILREQLKVIIFGGSKNVIPEAVVDDGSNSAGSLIAGILKGFGIIFAIIFVAFGILFIFFKLSNRNGALGFQDFIIERFALGGIGNRAPTGAASVTPVGVAASVAPVTVTPLAPSALTVSPALDPLADIAPATASSMESTLSADRTDVAESSETQIPDWLKAATESSNEASIATSTETVTETPATETPVNTMTESEVAEENRALTSDPEAYFSWENEGPLDANESARETPLEASSDTEIGVPAQDIPYETPGMALDDESLERAAAALPEKQYIAPASADLPDWLKSMNAPSIEVTDTGVAPLSDVVPVTEWAPEIAEKKPKTTPKKSTPKKPAIETLAPTVNTDDLPDWLK
jgi:PKD repeat protein